MRHGTAIKDGQETVGNLVRVSIRKNKVAPPFRQAEFDIMYAEGISAEGNLIDVAVEYNIIQKSGSWLSYGSERLGQGRENAKKYLKEHPEIFEQIDHEIRQATGQIPPAEESEKSEEAEEQTELGLEADAEDL